MSSVENNNEIERIDITTGIYDFLRTAKKIWFVLLVIVLVSGVSSGVAYNVKYQPSYTAVTTLSVSISPNASSSYYDNSTAKQLSKTFPYILTSDVLQRKVAKSLEMDSIPGTISASVMDKTNIMNISVTDTDAKRAYKTLQAVLETYPEVSESIVGTIYTKIMDESGIPASPDNPKNIKGSVVKGCFVGVIIAFLYTLIYMLTNRTVRNEEDCINRIHIKCIGTVPKVREKIRSRKVKKSLNILQKNSNHSFVESFRLIRNRIVNSAAKNNIKTILITSAMPSEGKSTLAVNIALSLALDNKKVAIVDCDLRNPTDHEILGVEKGPGIIDFLNEKIKFNECVLRGKDIFKENIPFLFVKGGDAIQNAEKYLSSSKMRHVIANIERQVDYVILDAPPVGLLTDASILAQYSQGIIMVVKKDFVKVDAILDGMEHLTDCKAHIMGCILNEEE